MSTDVLVQPVDSADDFTQIHHCFSEAFGRQIQESIWLGMNPNWDSPEGQRKGAFKLLTRWQSITTNKDGQPNTVILKATLPDPQDKTKRKIVGAAIWFQSSFVDGYGDPPTDCPAGLETLAPTEGRFLRQMYRSAWNRRVSITREKVNSDPPAIFILDICAVDPAFQRRGVAKKLVEWGIEDAKRRGELECMTEASTMGRGLYKMLGFEAEGSKEDTVFEIDEEFRNRNMPGWLIMRTWASQ
ncbi:Acyl- N-acyltransferase protein [Rutstroemia sp. NJR-2017a BVV2]|nr:Acyl- N-acyltransferase protein [Rutstroemia sp. NJR-2017a BVV2]